MQHNFYASLLVVSGVALAFHYCTMAESSYGCPVVIAEGDPETGKTKSVHTALSLVGKLPLLLSLDTPFTLYIYIYIYICRFRQKVCFGNIHKCICVRDSLGVDPAFCHRRSCS